MNAVKAGVSRVTISPPVGTYLVGFAGRRGGARAVRDDLYATALALSDQPTQAVLVSCDLLMLHPDLVARVRREASARTGIPQGNMMLCATHTHSGPGTYVLPDSAPLHRAYVDNLSFQLAGLIEMAHGHMAPARFGFGRGESRIGINRRLTRPDGTTVIRANPEGPVDPEVGVLRVDREDGEPLAVVVNYACHAVVLGANSNVISADWPGVTRRVIEGATGAHCLFLQGAAADINPWPGEPTDSEEVLERLGTQVAGTAIAAWAGIDAQPAHGVAVRGERILVPLLTPHGEDKPLIEMAEGALTRENLRARLHECAPWSAQMEGEGDDRRVAVELQAIRVGEMAVVAAAGEVFVETGLAVKRRAPLAHTMFAAYGNGSAGYFPPPEDYARGGYEVDESYLFYQLPAPVAPDAAGLVEEGALRLLAEVAGEDRTTSR